MYKRFLSICLLTLASMMMTLPVRAQVQENDTMSFWSVSYIDWPPLWGTPQRNFQAVCVKSGIHCRVFVETTASMPSQGDLDQLVTAFDSHFYPALTQKYGPVPDQFDHDSAVYIVALNESDWAGYFDPGQQMPDSMVQARWNSRSNEHEIIYIAADYLGSDAEGIVAHEFGHLLHWGKDHSAEAANPGIFWEAAFVDEGFSTFAAEYLTGDLYQHNVFDYGYFQTEPDIPLIYFSNYDQAKLFMTFMFEHYGQWTYIASLIGNQLNSWQGVENTLTQLGYSVTFKDVFEQFCIANFSDDSVYMGGKYSYAHFRFPACATVNDYFSYPVAPVEATVTPFGADYISLNSPTQQPVEIHFQGDSLSDFRLAFIEIAGSGKAIRKVHSVVPDASGRAVFSSDSLGSAFNKLIMVVMGTDAGLDTTEVSHYRYWINPAAGLNEKSKGNGFNVYPNPAKDRLFIEMPQEIAQNASLEIFDTSGHQQASFVVNRETSSIDISTLPAGAYIASIKSGKRSLNARFVCSR